METMCDCPICGRPVPPKTHGGPPRVYCSRRCNQAAFNAAYTVRRSQRRVAQGAKRCKRCRRRLPPYCRRFCSSTCRELTYRGTPRYQIPPTDYTRVGHVYVPELKRTIRVPAQVHSCPVCVDRGRGPGRPRREPDGVWVCDAIPTCLWTWPCWADRSKPKPKEEPMSTPVLSAAGAPLG